MSIQKSSPSAQNLLPSETKAAEAKPFDVYAIVPEAVHRKSTKNTWNSKHVAANRPRLTEDDILDWADAHFERTGQWPRKNTPGRIPESPESSWLNIDSCLRCGNRGLLGDSSLPILLAARRGVRNIMGLPPFTIEQILTWVDAHHARTGEWPTDDSGPIAEQPTEKWAYVHAALTTGGRGLPGKSSLARLLSEHRGVRNNMGLPPFSVPQILDWADAHHARTGEWPTKNSGPVAEMPDEMWTFVNAALHYGVRGLPGKSSLPQLLAQERGYRNVANPPPLTEDLILEWADAYFERTGKWPCAKDGVVQDASDESWVALNGSLINGIRGLSGGSSLAQLLAARRGKYVPRLRPLSEAQILEWADAYFARTGEWPTCSHRGSDPIPNTLGETWQSVNMNLIHGQRGLPGGSSLARLLAEERGRRRQGAPEPLTVDLILQWADAHLARTGKWPVVTYKCDPALNNIIEAPGESWFAVNSALRTGGRGLPGGTSLALLLEKHRAKTPFCAGPPLNINQILAWAREYHILTGQWPTAQGSGMAPGTDEPWAGIHTALKRGTRGLPGGDTLAGLLVRECGYRNAKHIPLTEEQILNWADAHYARTGRWPVSQPKRGEGRAPIPEAPGEDWGKVNAALLTGGRGLSGSITLAQFLAAHRGKTVPAARCAPLSVEQILTWAEAYVQETGKWPTKTSGLIKGTDGEAWSAIITALSKGCRSLPGGDSLARLLQREWGQRNPFYRAPLTEAQILGWADAHFARTGKWPVAKNKHAAPENLIPEAPGENWGSISGSLHMGERGLPGGSSLARLLAEHRGKVLPVRRTTPLSIMQILNWAQAHRQQTGRWPNTNTGGVAGAEEESWSAIDTALDKGGRGLPGGSSLSQLLETHLGKPPQARTTPLSPEQIFVWAQAHRTRTGKWPVKDSGPVEGSGGEVWSTINMALRHGKRGLPGGMNLGQLIRSQQEQQKTEQEKGKHQRTSKKAA